MNKIEYKVLTDKLNVPIGSKMVGHPAGHLLENDANGEILTITDIERNPDWFDKIEMNELLYGRGVRQDIVSVEVVKGKENTVQVFYRDNGKLKNPEYITYDPFIYVNDQDPIIDKLYDDTNVIKLLGNNYYNRMITSNDFGLLYWIRNKAKEAYMAFRQAQYMLQSGETQFKGMDFDGPLRLYCDIETITKEGYDFPNSSRPEDKITIISMLTNKGDEYILALNEDKKTQPQDNVYRCKDEKVLLEKFVRLVRGIDPDILIGHNWFGFDMPYIEDRAKLHGVELQLGRNGSTPNSFETSVKFAEKSDDYTNYQIYGRHIIDTYFLAKAYDVVARELDSYGLKYCADYLGGIGEDRTYVEGSNITNLWFNDRQKLIDYALDDVKETQLLDREWGRGIFESTKMIPLPMQDVARYGTGNKFSMLMERQYYKYRGSLPLPDEKEDYGGGYAQTFKYGYYG